MSRLGERKGHGVVDGDPVAIILLIGMMFVLLFWLGQSGAINPIGSNSTVTSNYSTAFTNTKWLLWLLSPMALYIIVNMGFDLSKDKVGLDE